MQRGFFRNSFGSLAMFAAMRRASSRCEQLGTMSALPPKADIAKCDRHVR
jgi:hypothetical protein